MNKVIINKSFCVLVMSLLSIFLFSLRVDARSNCGYNQISFNQHEIAYAPFSQVPWYATVNVGMSADKNNIYTAIDMGPWYQGTSFFPWWYQHDNYDYHDGYQLAIDNQSLFIEMVDTGRSSFDVIELYTGKKVGYGKFTAYNYNKTSWQFQISLKAIKKILNNNISENATISLYNGYLFKQAESITYAGSPTGPWLLAGIGLVFAGGGYYLQNQRRKKITASATNEVIHA